ncbi:MAG: phage tail protein [Magnetospirillum gryphiswaldense]|nr:phage tail protein [Magnetospirillum gryphiswaldense]
MEPFLGQISLFAFNNIPKGWALCNGAILQIQGNQALYSLLGTQFGGNGTTTFALPDLRGRVPMGQGLHASYGVIGTMAGAEAVTIDQTTCPIHNHDFQVNSSPGTQVGSKDAIYAATTDISALMYAQPSSPMVAMEPTMLAAAGASEAHQNMQPFQVLAYCIATTGVYPQRP